MTGLDHWTHPFGVASGGWDIYYGVIWGTRTAFMTGIVITFFVVVIGVLVGTISAFYGGKIDLVHAAHHRGLHGFPVFHCGHDGGDAVAAARWRQGRASAAPAC